MNHVDDLLKKEKIHFVGGVWEWENARLQSDYLYQAVDKCSQDMCG